AWQDPPSLASARQDPPSLSFGVAGPAFAQLRRGRLLAPPNLGQEEFQRFSLSAFQHLYCFPLRVYCLA
ncbi:MAG TPA: hypothetical protein PKH32_09070, partial [Verrucomicrobiota bacterium]|nr:hypothetical protein [Verrucomicrobiota bacterium]